MDRGHLIVMVGPEGGGKRRLLSYARRHALGRVYAIFPRRYICGPLISDREEFYRLDERTFADWVQRGFFALYWSDGCCQYGVGQEIDTWMDAGLNVVIAGDEMVLPKARQRYPDVQTVLVTPREESLEQWVRDDPLFDEGGREGMLSHMQTMQVRYGDAAVIRTNLSIPDAGRQLVAVLRRAEPRQVA